MSEIRVQETDKAARSEKDGHFDTPEVASTKINALPELNMAEDLQPDAPPSVEGARLLVIMLGFLLASSLMALDQTIISTALPSIASDFNAISQLSWIASGYFLAQAGLMLLYGRILAIVRGKLVLLVAITIFMAGSLICALSNTMQLLIFGRVIAGAGGGGIYVAVLSILAQIVPLEKRPAYLGSFGAVFAISSVIGPLLGGVFSEHLTWRWCFWINLPLGGFAFAVILILLPTGYDPSNDQSTPSSSWWSLLLGLDWLGSVFSIAMTVALLLPLQWGGNVKSWNDPAVIALFCVAGVLVVLFILWETYQGEKALLPIKLLTRRTQVGACLASMLLYVCFVIGTYFLPFFYQVKGTSATKSGIDILPYMLSGVISAAVAGVVANVTHHYWSFIAFPPAILGSVGAAMLFTVKSSTGTAKLIGFQILFGTGVGAALQNTILSVQAEFASQPELVSQATSVCSFSQLIGLSIGIAIGGAVLDNEFVKEIARVAPDIPGDIVQTVKQSVEVIATLPPLQRGEVIDAYTTSVSRVFLICVPCAILASLSATLIKNHKLTQPSA
ncbi:ABC transporter [Irpex rosettiformis]|uniref:ABC transporter n=1 Tax=Irpex rosettiformis TaxID=378272 RepID=A0ACB8UDQ8_9APHY|nr:ABC transporter [Irpex rosettiformis]